MTPSHPAPADPVGPDEVERVALMLPGHAQCRCDSDDEDGNHWVACERCKDVARKIIAAIRSARETPGDADEHACDAEAGKETP